MNYYQRHLGDYARDTGHLTLLEHGVYAVLLDWQYGTEKPLPADLESIHRICRAFSKSEKSAANRVRNEFFDEAGWNKRVKRELDKCADASWQKRRAALIKHHPELASLTDVQLQEWCTCNADAGGYALDIQSKRTTTRARAKTPLLQDAKTPLKVEGGAAANFPESVSDEAVIAFGKKFPGEPASGAPGPMPEDWIADFLTRINGRREWPRDWQRYMISLWRREFLIWKRPAPAANAGKFSEKSGASVSASVETIARQKKRQELMAELEDLEEQIRPLENAGAEVPREKMARLREIQKELTNV